MNTIKNKQGQPYPGEGLLLYSVASVKVAFCWHAAHGRGNERWVYVDG